MTEDEAPRRRPRRWRDAAPFVLALVLLSVVFSRLDWYAFLAELAKVSYGAYAAFGFVFVAGLLVADAFATSLAYRTISVRIGFLDLLVLRGSSYPASILNHHLGQAFVTYYLSRIWGLSLLRAAGATLLVYVSWSTWLLVLAGVAIVLLDKPLLWLALPIGIALAYTAVLVLRPAALVKRAVLAPLFESGVGGHLVAIGARLPHFCVLFAGTWLPFSFFGVDIPFSNAVATVPILVVVLTLPLTPQGFGTRDALAALFYERFAPGASQPERLAALAASTATWAVAITIVQAVLGLALLRWGLPALRARAAQSPESPST